MGEKPEDNTIVTVRDYIKKHTPPKKTYVPGMPKIPEHSSATKGIADKDRLDYLMDYSTVVIELSRGKEPSDDVFNRAYKLLLLEVKQRANGDPGKIKNIMDSLHNVIFEVQKPGYRKHIVYRPIGE